MQNTNDIKPGNLLELYTDGQSTEFVNDNEEMKNDLSILGVRVSRGVQKVISVDGEKINDIPVKNFEFIHLNNEWLTRLNAIPSGQSNIEIGKLHFKRMNIGLIYCAEGFEPISGEKIIRYVHQLQNIYKEKTGEELSYRVN